MHQEREIPQSGTNKSGAARWTTGTLTYTTWGLTGLFFWLLWGDFAWQMRDRSVPSVIQLLLSSLHASDTLAALMLASLPPLLSLVISPVVGYRSDRFRSKWGRRIPFLLVPTPFIVIAMVGLAFSPGIGAWFHSSLGHHSPGPGACTLIVIALFWTVFEAGSIVANSVFGGLINDVVPQVVIGRFFGLFRVLSLLAGIIFNSCIIGHAETLYFEIFIGVATLYGIGFTLMCLKVKEGEYPPVPEGASGGAHSGGFIAAASNYLRDCFSRPYFLLFFAMMATSTLASAPVNVFSLFYAKSINMEIADYGKCLALTYLISLVLAYPIGVLTDRFHPLRVCMAVLALYFPLAVWAAVCARSTSTFSIAFVAHGVLAGAYFTASASMGQRLLPRSRFTELMSANGIIVNLTSITVAPCVGLLLDHTNHVYRYTFFVGAAFALIAVATTYFAYRWFLELGGPDGYLAPE